MNYKEVDEYIVTCSVVEKGDFDPDVYIYNVLFGIFIGESEFAVKTQVEKMISDYNKYVLDYGQEIDRDEPIMINKLDSVKRNKIFPSYE